MSGLMGGLMGGLMEGIAQHRRVGSAGVHNEPL